MSSRCRVDATFPDGVPSAHTASAPTGEDALQVALLPAVVLRTYKSGCMLKHNNQASVPVAQMLSCRYSWRGQPPLKLSISRCASGLLQTGRSTVHAARISTQHGCKHHLVMPSARGPGCGPCGRPVTTGEDFRKQEGDDVLNAISTASQAQAGRRGSCLCGVAADAIGPTPFYWGL